MKNRRPISPYIFPGIRHSDLPEDLAKQMRIRIMRDPLQITESFIMDIVSSVTEISQADIIGQRRDMQVVDARRMFIYNVKKYLKKSYVHIGRITGNRDHTTVTFNIKKYEALYDTDVRFRRIADAVTHRIEFY